MSNKKILLSFAIWEIAVVMIALRSESYISGILVTFCIFSFVGLLLLESLSIKKIFLLLFSILMTIVSFFGALDPIRELFRGQKISPENHIVGYTQFNGYPKHFDFLYFFLLMIILWVIMVVTLKKSTEKKS